MASVYNPGMESTEERLCGVCNWKVSSHHPQCSFAQTQREERVVDQKLDKALALSHEERIAKLTPEQVRLLTQTDIRWERIKQRFPKPAKDLPPKLPKLTVPVPSSSISRGTATYDEGGRCVSCRRPWEDHNAGDRSCPPGKASG